MQYSSRHVRKAFLDFYAAKQHVVIPSAPLVPLQDPTVLFNTAGMQPLVPYLSGKAVHPAGNRLVDSQKCIRTGDIEDVGDNRHCTFFEMLGTWSIGDYFKRESVEWGFEFLTSPHYLGIDPRRLFVTVYKGDGGSVAQDDEAIAVWQRMFAQVGIKADVGQEYDFEGNTGDKYLHRITARSGKDNWWGLPYRGPCGPCSEIYYLLNEHDPETVRALVQQMEPQTAARFIDDQIIEIWNHVFMQYEGEKTAESEPKDIVPLAANNIDTGMGFERLLTVLGGFETVYQTDVLLPLVQVAERWSRH